MKEIFILDDHPLVSEGFRNIINVSKEFKVTKVFSDPKALYASLENKFDMLILDINLKQVNVNGFDVLKKIKNFSPKIKVLMLTMYKEYIFCKKAQEFLADGFLTKEIEKKELLNAIKLIFDNQKVFPSHLSFDSSESDLDFNIHEIILRLSPNEKKVLKKIIDGFTVENISKTLFLSPKTVSNYQTSIKQKLNARNNVHLINMIGKNKYLI